jgi:acyl carrier protein
MQMDDFPRKVLDELKSAVASGELRRIDRLDDLGEPLDRIFGDDSLDRVELVMAVETHYSVSIITVGDLIDFLEDRNSGGNATPVGKL